MQGGPTMTNEDQYGEHAFLIECEERARQKREETERQEREGPWYAEDDFFELDPVNLPALIEGGEKRKWLADELLVLNQATVIAGRAKTMKTSAALDIAVSIASGTKVFDVFATHRKRRVLVLSAESGCDTIRQKLRCVCDAKGVKPADVGDNLYLDFAVPQLGNEAQLDVLRRAIRGRNPEVVIIDPLYQSLRGVQTSISTEMGPLFRRLADDIVGSRRTLILVHHFRRTAPEVGKPELSELSHAAIEEFARQWLLIGRRKRYDGSGCHQRLGRTREAFRPGH
jgi:RecA-family ATPase